RGLRRDAAWRAAEVPVQAGPSPARRTRVTQVLRRGRPEHLQEAVALSWPGARRGRPEREAGRRLLPDPRGDPRSAVRQRPASPRAGTPRRVRAGVPAPPAAPG